MAIRIGTYFDVALFGLYKMKLEHPSHPKSNTEC